MWMLALQHGELVAQHQDLDVFRTIASTAQHQQVDHKPNETVETEHAPILAAFELSCSRERETAGHYAERIFRHPQVCNTWRIIAVNSPSSPVSSTPSARARATSCSAHSRIAGVSPATNGTLRAAGSNDISAVFSCVVMDMILPSPRLSAADPQITPLHKISDSPLDRQQGPFVVGLRSTTAGSNGPRDGHR
jgi:hypothetical protein